MGIRPGSTQILGGIGSSQKARTIRTTGEQVRRVNATAAAVQDPDTLVRFLNDLAGSIHDATQAARTVPFLNGTTIAMLKPTTAATVVNHNLGRPVAGWFCVRAQAAQWTGYEHADQNQTVGSTASGLLNPKTQVRLVTPTSGTFSLWFF